MSTRNSGAPNGGQKSNPSAPPAVRVPVWRGSRSGQGNTDGLNLAVKGTCK